MAALRNIQIMILRYRVSLPGLKGFARVYDVKDTTSLYTFHKKMRSDMDFPQDQLILFKAVNEEGKAVARYSTVELGAGTVDVVTCGACHKRGEDSFVYFYDTTNKKSVLVNFEGEGSVSSNGVYPVLVETKGPNPIEFENGYVAFEDLPDEKKRLPVEDFSDEDDDDLDDDDFGDEDDDEDDDESDEDGKEIYDEDED